MRGRDMCILSMLYGNTCSVLSYVLYVEACNLVPAAADAGVPWDPYHNASYMRNGVDMTELLQWEAATVKVHCLQAGAEGVCVVLMYAARTGLQERPVIDYVLSLQQNPETASPRMQSDTPRARVAMRAP